MNILIAEDERITRRSLQRQLETWGHDVVAAEDGMDAWELFEAGAFDIVVTDWEMPRLDGRALIDRIRGSDRAGYVYLIMLTGRSEKADIVEGMDAGADDYLAKPFDKDELRVRIHAGERIIRLERTLEDRNGQLQEANERMQRDLQAAAKIQQDLLPSSLPPLAGVRFAWHYRPCDELAGDLLNIVPIDEQRIAMYIADVSGHGVASSLVAVSVHRSLSLRHDQTSLLLTPADGPGGEQVSAPRVVAEQLNGIYPMSANGGHFITVVYGVIDVSQRRLRYCCAGHPSPILARRGDAPRSYETASFPIGIVPDGEYEDATLDLQLGDRVYIYSDGIIEAADPSRNLYGLERLESVIGQCAGRTLEESIDAIVQSVTEWQGGGAFADDLSLVAFECTEDW